MRRAGFTLLEVVVAVLVLEVAVLAALATLEAASRNLARAEHLERAVLEVEGVLDSLAAVEGPAPGGRAFVGGQIEWVPGPGGSVVVRAVDAEGSLVLEVGSAMVAP